MIFETVFACWFYGAWNIGNILKIITPPTPMCKTDVIQKILVFLWYITPFFWIILEYLNHIYYSSSLLIPYGYGFPNWTYGYGIFIFLVSVLQIPLWAIFKLCYNTWDNERKVGICLKQFMKK